MEYPKIAAQAAEQAAKAAREALESMRKLDTIQGLSQVISILREIKQLHRLEAWEISLDRYNSVRMLLLELRSTNPKFTDMQIEKIQAAITLLTTMENSVDKLRLPSSKPPNVVRMNRLITKQVDYLVELLEEVKNRQVQ